MRGWKLTLAIIALLALIAALAISMTERCTPDSPKGPTIGNRIRIGGC